MGDLEDFDESFESQSLRGEVQKPEQFNDVVDIIVSESRQKARDKQQKVQRDEEEVARQTTQNNWMQEINEAGDAGDEEH